MAQHQACSHMPEHGQGLFGPRLNFFVTKKTQIWVNYDSSSGQLGTTIKQMDWIEFNKKEKHTVCQEFCLLSWLRELKKVSLILEESEQLNPIVAGSSKIPS